MVQCSQKRLKDIETDRSRDRVREREIEREREPCLNPTTFSGETLLKNLWFWLLTLIWGLPLPAVKPQTLI